MHLKLKGKLPQDVQEEADQATLYVPKKRTP